MKRSIIFLVLLLSITPFNKLFSQQSDAILYEDHSLTVKPKPVDKDLYDKWMKENNKKYGEDPNSGPGVPLKVIITFIVDTLGNVTNPKISRGIGFGFDEEAYRLVKTNPNKWIPGSKNGKLVNTQVYYLVDFTTNKNLIMTQSNNIFK